MIQLKPGDHELTQTVDNPAYDRRRAYDWTKMELWQAGATFRVIEEALTMPEGIPDLIKIRITMPSRGPGYVALESEAGQRLAANLVPLEKPEEKPSDWLNREARGCDMASLVLDHLVATGRLTRADIEAALEACLDALHRES